MFQRLDHVGIAVKSLDEAIAKFEKVFGLKAAASEEIVDQQVRAALIPTSVGRFELLEPTSPDSAVGRFMARRGEGIHHICFAVRDVQEESAQLKARGVQLVQGAPRQGFTGLVEFVHPRSAAGILVEIAQITLFTPASTDLQFHHVTIATKDKDGAAAAWEKNLGMAVKHVRPAGGFQIATTWLDAGNTEVEFAQPVNETVAMARAIAERGEGIYAIALESSDPAAVMERARQQGIRVVEDRAEAARGTIVRVVHPRDFLGTMLFLLAKPKAQAGAPAGAAGGH